MVDAVVVARFIGQRAVAGETPSPPNGFSANAQNTNVWPLLFQYPEDVRILNPLESRLIAAGE